MFDLLRFVLNGSAEGLELLLALPPIDQGILAVGSFSEGCHDALILPEYDAHSPEFIVGVPWAKRGRFVGAQDYK